MKIQDDNKEMEIELLKLREENKKFKLQNIDENKYNEWTKDELIYWIISLNGKVYKQYENNLKAMFDKQSIDGSCIEDIEDDDWKKWGIQNFKERKGLIKHIKSLINKNKNKNNNKQQNINDAEGTNPPTAYI